MNIIKSIIQSAKLVNNVITIVTKSNVKKVYTFKSNKLARNYFNDITSWQYDYDIMSMTKSHGGISVYVFYQLNN